MNAWAPIITLKVIALAISDCMPSMTEDTTYRNP